MARIAGINIPTHKHIVENHLSVWRQTHFDVTDKNNNASFDVTDKNNNASFEDLDIHYH